MFIPKTDRDFRFLHHYKLSGETCFKTFFSKLHQYMSLEDKKNIPEWAINAIKELYPENLK